MFKFTVSYLWCPALSHQMTQAAGKLLFKFILYLVGKYSGPNSNKHLSYAITCNPTTLLVEIISEFNPVVIYVECKFQGNVLCVGLSGC